MIYSVTINNKAIVDNGLNISLQQAYILSGLHSIVANWEGMSRLQYEGRDYYWLSYSMVVGELPMLRIKHKDGDYTPIKKDTLYGIFKELANEGFLISHPENQKQGRAYYAFSPKMHLLFGKNTARNTCGYKSTPTDINPDTYGYKSLPPTDINPDNNSTKDNNTTDNSEEDTNVSSSSLEGSEIAIAIPSPSVEFFDFDVWAIQNELYELLKFPARLKKEKFAEKRKELTDTFFYKIMSDINGYIKNNPTYLDGVPATATKGAVEGKKQLASVLTTFVKKYNSNSNNTQITPFESVPDLREIYVNFWHSISYGAPCILGKHDLTNLKELAQKLKDANRSSGMPSMSEKDLLKVFLQHIPTFWRVSEKATPYILNRDCATIISQMHNSKNKSTHSASKLDLQAGVELMQQMDDQRTQAPKVMEAMGNFYADYISKFQNQNQNETPKP